MGRFGETGLEYLMMYGWAILIIIVVVGALFTMGVFKTPSYQEDYSSETKAFRTDEYACDLYIQYENDMVTNITLVDCIKLVN